MSAIPPQYAEITNAYAFGELICNSPENDDGAGETIFGLLREHFASGKCSMERALELLRDVASDPPDGVPPEITAKILEQMGHPKWKSYVAAHLGMM